MLVNPEVVCDVTAVQNGAVNVLVNPEVAVQSR